MAFGWPAPIAVARVPPDRGPEDELADPVSGFPWRELPDDEHVDLPEPLNAALVDGMGRCLLTAIRRGSILLPARLQQTAGPGSCELRESNPLPCGPEPHLQSSRTVRRVSPCAGSYSAAAAAVHVVTQCAGPLPGIRDPVVIPGRLPAIEVTHPNHDWQAAGGVAPMPDVPGLRPCPDRSQTVAPRATQRPLSPESRSPDHPVDVAACRPTWRRWGHGSWAASSNPASPTKFSRIAFSQRNRIRGTGSSDVAFRRTSFHVRRRIRLISYSGWPLAKSSNDARARRR